MEEKNCNLPCMVYSRVVGYFRPVEQWNKGKQQEFKDRKEFIINDEKEVMRNASVQR